MLIDSNIIIYATQPEFNQLRHFLGRQKQLNVSIISKTETLGYHKLSPKQKTLLEDFFKATNILPLDDAIVEQSIRLRQKENIPLADAIIAATALVFKIPLVTRNIGDFKSVVGLKVVDPFAKQVRKLK